MVKEPENLAPYLTLIQRWLPGAHFTGPAKPTLGHDGLLEYHGPKGAARYAVELKLHFRHQDAGVIAEKLKQQKGVAGPTKLLLFAPYVRMEQGHILERAQIDYVDLAGNAHIEAPGIFVHVEGRRPLEVRAAKPGRQHKAWIKTVLALLVEPQLLDEPYRVLATRADVALGTVAGCITDLQDRGLLLRAKNQRRIVDGPALVAHWVQAYTDTLRPKLRERRFQIRAENKTQLWERLETCFDHANIPWAMTGADAAERQTHYFRADETEIYAPPMAFENRELLAQLKAQPTGQGGKLIVIEPPGPAAIPVDARGPHMAPALLIYAELRYRKTQQAQEAAELMLPKVLDHGAH